MNTKLKLMLLLTASMTAGFLNAEPMCVEIPAIPANASKTTQPGKDDVFTYSMAPLYGCESCTVTTNVNPVSNEITYQKVNCFCNPNTHGYQIRQNFEVTTNKGQEKLICAVRGSFGNNDQYRQTKYIVQGTKEAGINKGKDKIYYLWKGTGRSNDTKGSVWKNDYMKMNLTQILENPAK